MKPWNAGRGWPTRTPRWWWTPTWVATRSSLSGSNRGTSRGAGSCRPTGLTSSPRARCSRGRRRRPLGRSTPRPAVVRWWCWRTCPGSTDHRNRCGTSSWSTAPRSAGPSSISTARSSSPWFPATTAGRSWCSPGRSNDNMEVVAVEGSFASVIGGAPAAAVVFTRDVNTRTANDQRIKELEGKIAAGAGRFGTRRAAGPARRAARHGPIGEAGRGGCRVRADPQHRTRPRGRFGAHHHPGGGTAAVPDQGRRTRDGQGRRCTHRGNARCECACWRLGIS